MTPNSHTAREAALTSTRHAGGALFFLPVGFSSMLGPFVGIDVSKDHLDVALRPGHAFRLPNDPPGHAELASRLAPLAPALVVMEATGGLELPALAALAAAGVAV